MQWTTTSDDVSSTVSHAEVGVWSKLRKGLNWILAAEDSEASKSSSDLGASLPRHFDYMNSSQYHMSDAISGAPPQSQLS